MTSPPSLHLPRVILRQAAIVQFLELITEGHTAHVKERLPRSSQELWTCSPFQYLETRAAVHVSFRALQSLDCAHLILKGKRILAS